MSLFKSETEAVVEKVPDREADIIRKLVAATEADLRSKYPPQQCRRAVHPKDHGCVEATFTIRSDLRDELRVGVFKNPGKTFRGAIRFSNATDLLGADAPASNLGMALKLYGVSGDRLSSDDGERTQDFLMINLSIFPFANVADFAAQKVGVRSPFPKPVPRPLDNSYFSAAPYLLGKGRVMKFRARPVAPRTGAAASPAGAENYLRDAMRLRLAEAGGSDILFEFQVQARDSKTLDVERDIENLCTEWDERLHPFETVATIAIRPGQDIDSPERRDFCERLFYTPWHGLKAHRPLGGINRARRAVYEASSKQRGCPVSPDLPAAPARR